MEATQRLLCAKTEEKGEGSGVLARSCYVEEEGGGSTCAQQGRWGSSAVKGADVAEAATGRKRIGERGGTHGPRVENMGWPGKKENGPGPREILQFFNYSIF
jgi:hypothetical protein